MLVEASKGTSRIGPRRVSTKRYVGSNGRVIGMQAFGASAPLKSLLQEYGFTIDNVVAAARDRARSIRSNDVIGSRLGEVRTGDAGRG